MRPEQPGSTNAPVSKFAAITRRSSSGEPVTYSANVVGKSRLSAARKRSMAKAMLKTTA